MNRVPTARLPAGDDLADMNGVVAYWGPPAHVVRDAGDRPSRRPLTTEETVDALRALATTLNSRTWSGTHALMSRRLDVADARGTTSDRGQRRAGRQFGVYPGIVAPAA